jgi:acetyl-CoA acetyltransferase
MTLKDKAAIVGIGATEFSKNSGRSELRLAVEAVMAALNDAGLSPRDVDGLCTTTMDNNLEIEVFRNIGGVDLKYFSRVHYGGGGTCAPVLQAVMAVALGVADVVVCYRAMNERSQYRFGTGAARARTAPFPTSEATLTSFHSIHGLRTAAASIAIVMRRYMHDFGVTSADFAPVAVACRRHAATNPAAWFYQKPITIEDHQASRMVADPFRLLDCCQESDGGVAIVVTSAERARDLRQKPAMIRAAAQGATDGQQTMTSYYRPDITAGSEMRLVGNQMYRTAELTPEDMDVAILYDHFAPTIFLYLEALGFCGRGEAKDFVKNGNIEIGGRLPINTHGGQIGEAYMHGFNGISEGVRQIRGTSVNQVASAEHVLVTGGIVPPTSGLILGRA